ncbi:hypothetical protein Cme02nite_47300 [Catellatospora methionotrophica]|uniref:Tyr recombinase domain-containing protein n=1 Tax=Catellatospora methionotrophica TaxID=121620 RepID=A0A8J3PHG5_9ACTN|nr:hypothetical protein Cme02nite_47300 [Catellatospora methionotrophica]
MHPRVAVGPRWWRHQDQEVTPPPALPRRGTDALARHKRQQDQARQHAGDTWRYTGLVFTSSVGTALDAANVRRAFRRVAKAVGLAHTDWTPRQLRHSFVSLLSDSGMRLEDIAELCGHAGTRVTEAVYRHQLRPMLLSGATAMDEIFAEADSDEHERRGLVTQLVTRQ